MYTQQATGSLRDNANNDPQGLSSIFHSFGERQQSGGGIGNLIGGMLGGSSVAITRILQNNRNERVTED